MLPTQVRFPAEDAAKRISILNCQKSVRGCEIRSKATESDNLSPKNGHLRIDSVRADETHEDVVVAVNRARGEEVRVSVQHQDLGSDSRSFFSKFVATQAFYGSCFLMFNSIKSYFYVSTVIT